jgi:putative membrane protein
MSGMDDLPPSKRGDLLGDDASTELSSNRTAMSFQRTRASLDRTLMSVVRTSLSLIGFGFTLFQVFHSLINKVPGAVPTHAPRNMGLSLIALGVLLLVLGLINHVTSSKHLQARRERLRELGLIRHAEPLGPSTITVIAMLLLLIGVLCFASILLRNSLLA